MGVDKVEIVPRGEVVSDSRWTINIVNLAGQTLENIPVNRFPYTLSVTDYPAGIYFVRLEDEGGAFQMLKMIKI